MGCVKNGEGVRTKSDPVLKYLNLLDIFGLSATLLTDNLCLFSEKPGHFGAWNLGKDRRIARNSGPLGKISRV